MARASGAGAAQLFYFNGIMRLPFVYNKILENIRRFTVYLYDPPPLPHFCLRRYPVVAGGRAGVAGTALFCNAIYK